MRVLGIATERIAAVPKKDNALATLSAAWGEAAKSIEKAKARSRYGWKRR
jgi:hypothetical protein